MKRFIIVGLVLIMVGVGFYFGYQMTKSNEDQSEVQVVNNKNAMAHAEEVEHITIQIVDAIKTADYDKDWLKDNAWQHFLPDSFGYQAYQGYNDWVLWICKTFKANPIVSVEYGKVYQDKKGRPTVPYKITLKDGKILAGDLPFEYDSQFKKWYGVEGMDWHLRPNPFQP
ncbi:MAG: hypothetical protein ACE14V_04655 [bacterium]